MIIIIIIIITIIIIIIYYYYYPYRPRRERGSYKIFLWYECGAMSR